MFVTDIDILLLNNVIAVIIGEVAIAFFVASTPAGTKKHIETAYSGSTSGVVAFCTDGGAQQQEIQSSVLIVELNFNFFYAFYLQWF